MDSSPKIAVRHLEQRSVPKLVPTFQSYRSILEPSPSAKETQEYLSNRVKDDHAYTMVAESPLSSHYVGFLHAFKRYHSTSLQPEYYIQALYTAPAFRGQGIAKNLLAEFVSLVGQLEDNAPLKRVTLMTRETNEAARTLYEKQGFCLANNTEYVHYEKRFNASEAQRRRFSVVA